MYMGCHVSIKHGYLGAAKTAVMIGANAFQYFPKNPRSMGVKDFDKKDAAACRQFSREHELISIAHTAYPINLAVEESMYLLTLDHLRNDLEIAEACGSRGVVVHFGQSKGGDPLEGYKRMIFLLNELLSEWQGEAKILIENNAGQGNRMGTTIEELIQVRSLLTSPERVGFCLDTCHAFASGLWRGGDWEEVADKMRTGGFFSALAAVHLNDSVYPCCSFRDRHASIGRGEIGLEPIRQLLQTPELSELPIILETPAPADGGHRQEIALIRQLAEKETAVMGVEK
ncbi:deoxyribonuclease IV [Brevibacillus ruminantium]|uniref:Deoxyribonuclease IV n=1 Tax=Brevibacillus ruminantium TaxID=2950604 RepID=A0ABY4WGI0_9BACL|nr:deoxyribonuclease IV [Brevibacillus ruminantium]USG63761.1 deoxyribonuclease IV [Brevibacillus ruminantium]